ncbi:S1-like domain-containing RNA-binding protein [bacterium]|nr:S1-like domain-containing RNA-binding protein [Akkermansiaceae bacterium]MDB4393420.1 S1-like domain-containing RNA-binding protein [bacterium]MDA7930134.1 S1-like domain-containing RNA-binding protein [Akkermansiaceae bacterium]MDA7934515.1 S1-like domain-containing RNA-binding protein [Akkermansiaceae bacterium]MDB4423484.1 S1-like domain-containing RNA-binding protein [bacterium]
MAKIGERAKLPYLREVGAGSFLDGGELGEILLPKGERMNDERELVDVFIYRDSDDLPIATQKAPKVTPGNFGVLRVLASNNTGAFLDWGLNKDLLLPYSEQRNPPKVGQAVVVYVYLDPKSERLVASQRISRHFSTDTPDYPEGAEVDMIIFGRTDMGYKAIVDGKYSGLLFKNQVFEELFYADEIKGYVTQVRNDRKVDLSLYAPGNAKVEDLETRLERELNSRGGFWAIDDKSSPETINLELGVSKKVFKKATGALFKKRKIAFEDGGIRWIG